ncbi:MAG: histidinol dehydrogenase, partial [Akkermansia sp.]
MSHELTYRLTILVAFGIYALKVFQFHLMKIYRASDSQFEQMKQSMNRRAIPEHDIRETVAHIIADVATRGDDALIDYSRRFDKVELTVDTLQVSETEMIEAERLVPDSVKEAIAATMANIAYFSSCSQRKDWTSHNAQGVEFGERFMPYDRVGIYIPGGKAPLVSTSLMTGGFAKAAGVKQIVAATPAGPDGKVNSALLYALKVAGATEIIK